mmetsp:Transcript_35041/g.46113  ORF Transcript_35041/g.46113 Transcript_35041/m.46113 type:complete len:357 (+) Transcript_35041:1791-2861(+)
MGAALDIVLDSTIDFVNSFEVLCHLEVSVLQVNPVVLLGNFDSLVPLTAAHVELDEQVIPAALTVELLGVVDHIQLDRHHCQACFDLFLALSLSSRFCTASESHVAEANHSDIETLGLDAHLGHVLPHGVVMNVAHAVVGLVHVADGEEVREVHDRILDRLVHVLKTHEILHGLAQDNHGVLLIVRGRIAVVILETWLPAHKVEVWYLNTKKGLLSLFELDNVLSLDTVIGGDEESLERLTLELFFLNAEVIFDLAFLDSGESLTFGLFSSCGSTFRLIFLFLLALGVAQFGVFSLDGEQARIVLVPEGFDGDSIRRHLERHEVVHVNVIDVDLGIRDSDGREGHLVREDSELLAI